MRLNPKLAPFYRIIQTNRKVLLIFTWLLSSRSQSLVYGCEVKGILMKLYELVAEDTGIGVFVVRMFWHWRRYGAARMLINDEDPDNMQRHDSVKPVGCCFLCILIDPSLLFNMTAAPRATIRPCLCYLLFCASQVTLPCYSLFVEICPLSGHRLVWLCEETRGCYLLCALELEELDFSVCL